MTLLKTSSQVPAETAVEVTDGLFIIARDGNQTFLAEMREQVKTAVREDEDEDKSPLLRGRPFPGMAFIDGLVDMWGNSFEFETWDPDVVARRTKRAIKDYQNKGMPGLPIDARQHDKGDAAGWIVDASTGQVNDSRGKEYGAIFLTADWTTLGVSLISERILANFSPTIDIENQLIMGGSLTNWPATIDKKGIPLFDAIELSRQAVSERESDPENTRSDGGSTMTENFTMTEEARAELQTMIATAVSGAVAELEQSKNAPAEEDAESEQSGAFINVAELASIMGLDVEDAEEDGIKHLDKLAELVEAQANLKWQKKLSQLARDRKMSELSQRVTGGTMESPRGIPVDAETLKTELSKLDESGAAFWGGLLETVVNHGLTQFAEYGKDGKQVSKSPVPEFAVSSLVAALAAGNSAEDFFQTAGLGSADQYDLAPYTK